MSALGGKRTLASPLFDPTQKCDGFHLYWVLRGSAVFVSDSV